MKKVRQHDIKDCGAACLATILRHYKSFVSIIQIREYMHVDKNGANMYALCQAAQHFGLEADAYIGTFEEIKQMIKEKEICLPLISHIVLNDMYHYVVIEKVSSKYVFIFDPAQGEQRYEHEKFKEVFTGYFVTLIPGTNFTTVKKSLKAYKKFLAIIMMQKPLFCGALLLSIVLAGLSILCSFSFQTIIDKYILNGVNVAHGVPLLSVVNLYLEKVGSTLPMLIVAVLIIYLLQSTIFSLRGVIITQIYKNSSKFLISQYCSTLIKLPIPFFHDRETGEILSRYNDIEEIQQIISGVGLSIIMDLIMAVAGAIVLCSISSELFIVVLALTLSYAIITLFYMRPMKKVSRDIMEANSCLISRMKEAIEGIESIKSSSAEMKMIDDLEKKANIYIDKSKRGSILAVTQSTFLQLSESIGSVIILWIGCDCITRGILTLGAFISFQTLMYFFISPINNMLSMQLALQQAIVSADRLNDVLENKTEDALFNGTKKMTTATEGYRKLCIENLTFSYGYGEPVLKNISLCAKSSEKVAVMGKSGCGKTTLFHILSRLEDRYQGRITIDDEDIRNFDKASCRENIIYIPQDSTLFAGSYRENILMGREIDDQELRKVIAGCELNDLIYSHDNGLKALVEEGGKNLSGGQRQRISIARALVRKPQILLLDESTSHIDAETEDKIFSYIEKEFPDTIIFFSTHKENIATFCDKTIYIENGQILSVETR